MDVDPATQQLLIYTSGAGGAASKLDGRQKMSELRVDFTTLGNSDRFVHIGWCQPELEGTWTSGRQSCIRLPRDPTAGAYTVRLAVRPLIHPVLLLRQEIIISANGQDVFHERIDKSCEILFQVPVNVAAIRDIIELKINCPDATSPAALGYGHDVRIIAFCMSFLTLQPSQLPKPAPVDTSSFRPQPRVAAVTMVYNESEMLPIWLAHNTRQVGVENCYVVDHGSDDGSTELLGGAIRVRIPRSPYDPHKQSEWNSDFCSSLLHWYDAVIYSDVDEIVVADPDVAATLREFCALEIPEVVNVIGLNLQHRPDHEPAIELARPIAPQRPFAFFCSPMCKPLLIRRRVVWSPGSHSADAPVAFHNLYVFHLRWFDLPLGLARLQRTRSMAWGRRDAGDHSRVGDERLIESYNSFASLPVMEDIDFSPNAEPLLPWLDKVRASQAGRETELYKISLDYWPTHLWRVPDRFLKVF